MNVEGGGRRSPPRSREDVGAGSGLGSGDGRRCSGNLGVGSLGSGEGFMDNKSMAMEVVCSGEDRRPAPGSCNGGAAPSSGGVSRGGADTDSCDASLKNISCGSEVHAVPDNDMEEEGLCLDNGELQMGSEVASPAGGVACKNVLPCVPRQTVNGFSPSGDFFLAKSLEDDEGFLHHAPTPPSSILRMDSCMPPVAAPSIPAALRTCTQGVCWNAVVTGTHAVKDPGGANSPHNPWFGRAPAWRKSPVVPLPSMEELGQFSLDGNTAILDEVEVDATLKKFEYAVVGRMFGRRIPYSLLSGELYRRWNSFGKFRLINLSNDCFVCVFNSLDARDAVLLGGPWIIMGQVLGVDRWSSAFSPASLDGFRTPVWVRMPGLPLYCWGSKNIARIAALLGDPLWIDSATDQVEKGMFARTCVRIDLSKPLKPGVWVQGRHGRFFQNLEYEGLSVFCFRCCHVGHKEVACKLPVSKGVRKEAIDASSLGCGNTSMLSKTLDSTPLVQLSSPHMGDPLPNVLCDVKPHNGDHLVEDRGAGPWMMVTRKRRSSKGNPPWTGRVHPIIKPSFPPLQTTVTAAQIVESPPPQCLSDGGEELLHGGSSSVSPHGMGDKEPESDKEVSPISLEFSAMPKRERQMDTAIFLAKPSATVRSKGNKIRGAKKEKMVCELGPVAPGLWKRRKAQSLTDGGDASPSPPP